MNDQKQLIVFSNGDAWDASTWSNVPYMFLTTFKRICPNVEIHTFDMSQVCSGLVLSVLVKCWNRIAIPLLGPFCSFDRTSFWRRLLTQKMRNFEKHVARGGGVLLSFDFSNPAPRLAGYKTVLFCDWTIDYAIREHQHRTPTASEKRLIERQSDALSDANLVVSLFPRSAELIRESSPKAKVCYFGLPANIVDEGARANFERFGSRRLLFIGKPAYLASLRVVVQGLEAFNSSHPGFELGLDVIGMESGPGGGNVTYHGFLRKDIDADRDLFYGLIASAKALVTVSDSWVGASSIVEAMSLGTPAIVTPNIELKAMLGDLDWGFWCEYSSDAVSKRLSDLDALTEEGLRKMCHTAADTVEDFTWENLVRNWCAEVGFEKGGE